MLVKGPDSHTGHNGVSDRRPEVAFNDDKDGNSTRQQGFRNRSEKGFASSTTEGYVQTICENKRIKDDIYTKK